MEKPKSSIVIKFSLVLIFIVIFFSAWAYIQTELITSTSDFVKQEVCIDENQSPTKYYKVLAYNKLIGTAELLCVRENQSQTTYHKLNLVKTDFDRKEDWKIIYTQKVYGDGSFFWPIYI